jgi:LacI family transcriptional regulator
MVASLYLYRTDHLELNNFWVRLLLQSLEHALSEEGWTTQFFNRVQAPTQPLVPLREAIAALIADGVDAIAINTLGMEPKEVDDSLSVLDGQDLPVVCVTTAELSRPVPHLFYDSRIAGYQAADHLLRRGCREILCLAPFDASWVRARLEGVHSAVEYARLPANAVRVFPQHTLPWVMEEDPEPFGYDTAQAALEAGLLHSGVVCVNDGVALGFLRAAAERGLTPGTDFALVSFDDHPAARSVGLTTLRPPIETMGREAARLLSRALLGETNDLQVRLRSHLIPRRSTRTTRP